MDWSPFRVASPGAKAQAARGWNGPDGLPDRLRTAAFAELQAREAFRWAARRFAGEAPRLCAEWERLAAEEDRHYGWILARLRELGGDPAERAVSDGLWRALTSCSTAAEFAGRMAEAERRGKAAEESFARQLAGRDPETAAIFARIAADETAHIELQARF